MDLKRPESFTSPELLHDELIKTVKAYHPSTDVRSSNSIFTLEIPSLDAIGQ